MTLPDVLSMYRCIFPINIVTLSHDLFHQNNCLLFQHKSSQSNIEQHVLKIKDIVF